MPHFILVLQCFKDTLGEVVTVVHQNQWWSGHNVHASISEQTLFYLTLRCVVGGSIPTLSDTSPLLNVWWTAGTKW